MDGSMGTESTLLFAACVALPIVQFFGHRARPAADARQKKAGTRHRSTWASGVAGLGLDWMERSLWSEQPGFNPRRGDGCFE